MGAGWAKGRRREGKMAGGRTENPSGFALACGRRDEENKKEEGEREGGREGWLLQSCPHCTARDCFCPPDSVFSSKEPRDATTEGRSPREELLSLFF